MFKEPFSFEGRIRRSEYGISGIIYGIFITVIQVIAVGSNRSDNSGSSVIAIIFFIPMLWFMWAQGAKRCHDLGNSGWWQLIPFYAFWLIFEDGESGKNKYGDNPKGSQNNIYSSSNPNQSTPLNQGGVYQGGYNGGHNNPNSSNNNLNQSNNEEYQSGDLYR
jgi:uncharacterized membrane protein YhaH (DUF805 family)